MTYRHRIMAGVVLAGMTLTGTSASAGAIPQADLTEVGLTLSRDAGSAEPVAGDPPPEYYDGGIFDTYSRALFWFNRQVYGGLNAVSDWWDTNGYHLEPPPPSGLRGDEPGVIGRGVSNVAANLINEPVTALAGLVGGDLALAGNAVGRFSVNTTLGILGWNDVAADFGMEPKVADIGLMLCQAGVGEGAYVVLPFIGPRTVRDGFADVVLVNAILWTSMGAILGTGASFQTILAAEAVEIVADIIATRQIDPNAKVVHFDDFEAVRAAYLAQRRARCAAMRGAG